VAMVQRMASTGFVRSRLTVLQGGANGATASLATATAAATAVVVALGLAVATIAEPDYRAVAMTARIEQIRTARAKGYEGDNCSECGNFTLVRNGTCLKCDTCGSTSGCS
jgi:ribonucleoside-diphosphate reductase alpha chain